MTEELKSYPEHQSTTQWFSGAIAQGVVAVVDVVSGEHSPALFRLRDLDRCFVRSAMCYLPSAGRKLRKITNWGRIVALYGDLRGSITEDGFWVWDRNGIVSRQGASVERPVSLFVTFLDGSPYRAGCFDAA